MNWFLLYTVILRRSRKAQRCILGDQMSNGMRALLLVLGSAVLGAVYFSYLKAEPFPPDIVRIVPIVWLAGAVVGGRLAARALRSNDNRVAAGLALALSIPNSVFAALFSMAALMGD
jgi:hypothetical protein